MKKMVMGVVLASTLILAGCASGPNQTVGTAAGGVAGYAVGKALGGDSAGRALGAVTGAVIGSSVGQSMDQQQQQAQGQPPQVIYRERVIVRDCYWVREYDRYYGTMRERRICR